MKFEIWNKQIEGMEVDIQPVSKLFRLLNFILDSIFFLLIYGVLTLIYLIVYVKATPPEADSDPIVTLLPYILIIPGYFLYYFISEYFFHPTFAKRITKTKVVSINQSSIKLKQIVIRTIARIIPFEAASYMVTEVGMHDILSKTMVIRSLNSKYKP